MNLIWMFTALLQNTNGQDELVPECISTSQLSRAMQICCIEQRDNKTLWSNIIDCHRPISDEVKVNQIYHSVFYFTFFLCTVYEDQCRSSVSKTEIRRRSYRYRTSHCRCIFQYLRFEPRQL